MNALPPLTDAQVAIVGLGLMGGSLAAALAESGACKRIVGVARRGESIEQARRRGWIDAGSADLAEGVEDADLVVLATPPRVILAQVGVLGPLLKAGCVVMDLASTKMEIVRAMEDMPDSIHPVGGHPMCGKERPGLGMADADLYRGRPFVLIPLQRTPDEAISLARSLVEAVGGEPAFLDAEEHDRMVAWVSHLPHLVAIALVRAAMSGAEADPQLWSLAAGGFRDTTRLAASDRTMMLDIFATNRGPVLDAARELQGQVQELCDLLEAGDEETLVQRLDEAIARRREVGR